MYPRVPLRVTGTRSSRPARALTMVAGLTLFSTSSRAQTEGCTVAPTKGFLCRRPLRRHLRHCRQFPRPRLAKLRTSATPTAPSTLAKSSRWTRDGVPCATYTETGMSQVQTGTEAFAIETLPHQWRRTMMCQVRCGTDFLATPVHGCQQSRRRTGHAARITRAGLRLPWVAWARRRKTAQFASSGVPRATATRRYRSRPALAATIMASR